MPYHADVIGSLLRPRYLSEARAALTAGRMSNTEFKRIEDRAVDQAIALQEGCGLDVVNDGELRRFSFLDHLLGDMEGVADMPGAPVHFHAPDPAQDWNWHPPFTVTGRIRPKGPMMTIEEFSYARGRARVPVKITMPSPLVMYGAWSPEHSRPAYSDAFELFADAADIIRAEAAELARLGCTYIQIDAPQYAALLDPELREGYRRRGSDPDRLIDACIEMDNAVIGDVSFDPSTFSFVAGIVLFSGSLYLLATTGLSVLGAITPIGTTREGLWEGMRRERSAVRSITRFDPSIFRSHNAAEVNDFDPANFIESKRARRLDRFGQFSVATAKQAMTPRAPRKPSSSPTIAKMKSVCG